jgi:pimeloyl-ACP methyl ester carboxylesterase
MHMTSFRRRCAAAVLLLVAAVSTGCGGHQASTVVLGSCGPDAEGPNHPERCGTFQVPLDWAHPNGDQMTLHVLVVPASGPDKATDPVFYLAGFGGSAIQNAQWPYDHFDALEESHDLVFVEQRGTGGTAETCNLPPAALPDARAYRDAVSACLASLKRDPRHDTTPSAVRDLDRAREMLGYDKVDLYAGSYAVSMGLAYLQAHPEHVRTAVLESGSLLDVRLWQLVPTAAQHAFDELVARCKADPVCGATYNPAGDLATLVARLRAAPVTVDLGGGSTQLVTLPDFLNGIIDGYLATPQTAVLLPGDLAALVRGEWADVLTKRSSSLNGGGSAASGTASLQVQEATLECSDEWAQVDPAAVAAQSGSLFVAATEARAALQQQLCAAWPHDEGVRGAVTTTVPVLFVNGTADPADPPANVAAAAATMPNATFIAVPGGGHGVINGCLIPLAEDFIIKAVAPDTGQWQHCLDMSPTTWKPAFPSQ